MHAWLLQSFTVFFYSLLLVQMYESVLYKCTIVEKTVFLLQSFNRTDVRVSTDVPLPKKIVQAWLPQSFTRTSTLYIVAPGSQKIFSGECTVPSHMQ